MKRAVVVGASSGIGREVARLLLADGWHVGVAARRIALLEELKEEFPGQVITSCIDVEEDCAPQKLRNLIGELGGIELFFYASGIGKQNMQLDCDIEARTIKTNAVGFAQMIGAAYNYMSEHQGGHIAMITSIAGTKGLGAAPSYSATKAFQSTYIEALEQQARMRRLNIRFTELRPGFVDTDLLGTDKKYPMLMRPEYVAREIVGAINSRKSVHVIDWRYRVLTFFWRLIPRRLWVRLRITNNG
ncbi:MAG: SDR family NAD(P)-dependent oxidoreductase [Prevotella sp.]|uniref:SDR family NAD(P)-dependent oxidoreductase n=1 Tax=Prevotella sp. TaxID=59823 RepID=UPI002A283B1C|nr:SDR family NAD(P)-dependent oxidoreductase [Prevotella sp.]MDD7319166.1 SDR family NAD(P)-dependent oxidoreductase [Prevotellaceae bacterium]MDY4020034.1 SDR family NAD(P)-dependent oxidoreductase [Prevotella sp.]